MKLIDFFFLRTQSFNDGFDTGKPNATLKRYSFPANTNSQNFHAQNYLWTWIWNWDFWFDAKNMHCSAPNRALLFRGFGLWLFGYSVNEIYRNVYPYLVDELYSVFFSNQLKSTVDVETFYLFILVSGVWNENMNPRWDELDIQFV